MNIAFIVNNYPPRTGGVELHVQALATELVNQGHGVTVVTLGMAAGWRDDEGISVLTLPEHLRVADILGFPSVGTRRELTKLLKNREIDLVSVHTRFFPMSFVGWRAARAAGVPVIHTEHGSDHVVSDSVIIRAASRAVDKTLGRALLRGSDRVLGVSENVVDFVHRLAGVDAETFYNAIVASPYGAEVVGVERPQHLVFVGRIVPGKGWDVYLETFAELHAKGLVVTGEILGDGTDLSLLRQRISDLGLTELVAVRGRVSPSQVREALRGATLVNPTTLAEGFQTTLLEALVESGRVVTYPVPGAAALAEKGAPVRVTSARNVAALSEEIEVLIASPPQVVTSDFMEEWLWPARIRQYLRICADVQADR